MIGVFSLGSSGPVFADKDPIKICTYISCFGQERLQNATNVHVNVIHGQQHYTESYFCPRYTKLHGQRDNLKQWLLRLWRQNVLRFPNTVRKNRVLHGSHSSDSLKRLAAISPWRPINNRHSRATSQTICYPNSWWCSTFKYDSVHEDVIWDNAHISAQNDEGKKTHS